MNPSLENFQAIQAEQANQPTKLEQVKGMQPEAILEMLKEISKTTSFNLPPEFEEAVKKGDVRANFTENQERGGRLLITYFVNGTARSIIVFFRNFITDEKDDKSVVNGFYGIQKDRRRESTADGVMFGLRPNSMEEYKAALAEFDRKINSQGRSPEEIELLRREKEEFKNAQRDAQIVGNSFSPEDIEKYKNRAIAEQLEKLKAELAKTGTQEAFDLVQSALEKLKKNK